jgi:hypothetical protein
VKGAHEKPHWPITSSVTPWQTWLSALPSASSTKSLCVWMSMKPGATTRPAASSVAAASPRSWPIAAMRPCFTPTSAR